MTEKGEECEAISAVGVGGDDRVRRWREFSPVAGEEETEAAPDRSSSAASETAACTAGTSSTGTASTATGASSAGSTATPTSTSSCTATGSTSSTDAASGAATDPNAATAATYAIGQGGNRGHSILLGE